MTITTYNPVETQSMVDAGFHGGFVRVDDMDSLIWAIHQLHERNKIDYSEVYEHRRQWLESHCAEYANDDYDDWINSNC